MSQSTVESEERDTKRSQKCSSTGGLHLLPLLPPPPGAKPPTALLGRLRQERLAFTTENPRTSWVTTSHAFPAAYPRIDTQSSSRVGSSEQAALVAQELVGGQQQQSWQIVQRIVPVRFEECSRRTELGTTLILLQPSHLATELLEPMLRVIATEMERNGEENRRIEEIFCLTVQEEEGGFHNGVRDLQQFIESYMPVPTPLSELSTYGPQWHRDALTRQGKGVARRNRKLVMIAQGMTAGMAAQLSASSPNLLDSIIALSPETSSSPQDISSWDGKVQQLHARFSHTGRLSNTHKLSESLDQKQAWSQLSTSAFSGRLHILRHSSVVSRVSGLQCRAHIEQIGEDDDPFHSPHRLGEAISRLLKRPEPTRHHYRAHL